jgi:predicted permease
MLRDIRLSVRTLARHKGFTLAALSTLTLAIGVTTTVFSIVDGVLLRPLPYSEPDRIVRLSEQRAGGTPVFSGQPFSNVTYHAWMPSARTIGPIASCDGYTFTVGFDEPVRVRGAWASPELFEILRIAPQIGRFFTGDDVVQGAPGVVVLSDGLWAERFGRSADAIGRTLTLDGRPFLVVGVAPRGFAFPENATQLWVVARSLPPPRGGRDGRIQVTGGALARLAPGSTPADAAAEGTAAARGVEWPSATGFFLGQGGPVEIRVKTLADDLTEHVKPALLVFLAGVGCLMLMACANVAHLFLSRGVARERELAVRTALGASRFGLIRQALTESIIIATAGGVIGMAAALACVRLLPIITPERFPRLDAVHIGWRSVVFAAAVSLAAGVLSGLTPALRSGRTGLVGCLRESGGGTASRRTIAFRALLLASEAALAVMLVVAATLLGRSFARLLDVEPGFDRRQVLASRIHLSEPGQAVSDAFLGELLARLRAMPDVMAAGAGNMMPMGESAAAHTFTPQIAGREPVTVRGRPYWVTPGYAEAVGLRLRAGRFFNESDLSRSVQSMLVNEEFVHLALPGVEPIGLQVPSMMTGGVTAEIVGVVANVLKDGLASIPQPEIYIPAPAHKYSIRGEINLVVRTSGDPLAHAATVRQLVRQLRPDAAIDRMTTLEREVSTSVAQSRFAALVVTSFAVLAVMLAAIGLYGMLSYMVASRRRELGIRVALGASRATLIGMVLREGVGVTAAGVAAGLLGAAVSTRFLRALLFRVEPLDAYSFATAAIVLICVAIVACSIPGGRAASIDPATALRTE